MTNKNANFESKDEIREIARETKESSNTVKSRYRRSIMKLRKVLGGAKHE